MNYLFTFGNTPELSKLELDSVYSGGDPLPIAYKLGGTVKIAEEFAQVTKESDIPDKLISYLASLKQPKVDFGISGPGNYSKIVKRGLEDQGIKVRFVLPREGDELSSVVVAKQKLIELVVRLEGGVFKLGHTIWVQDFESWNARDYNRPAVDPHAGMLPPKIARMMVNISKGKTILDPFCGVGTVLAEGLMTGTSVYGSDISSLQVDRSRKNLEWLNKHPYKLFQSDARNVALKLTEKVDAIVTEPDLGPNTGKSHDMKEKLGFLYLSALDNWKNVLKPGGRVVMVVPSFTMSKDKEVDLVKMVLDRSKIMGYIEFNKPIEYYRPQAVVRRNIIFLTYGTY